MFFSKNHFFFPYLRTALIIRVINACPFILRVPGAGPRACGLAAPNSRSGGARECHIKRSGFQCPKIAKNHSRSGVARLWF